MTSTQKGIAVRQKMLECIIRHIEEKGYAPSVRELGDMVGLKSTSTVHAHLQRMNDDGLIVSEIDKPRAIKVVGYKFVKEVVADEDKGLGNGEDI